VNNAVHFGALDAALAAEALPTLHADSSRTAVSGLSSGASGVPAGSMSWAAAQGFGALGRIDPPSGISKLKVYVFGGTKDQVVHPEVVSATCDFFVPAGVMPRNLERQD
jgi:hypothetical protein